MKHTLTFLFLFSFISLHSQIYLDTSYSVGERVEDLLSQMTLEEKVGQMTQVNWQDLEIATDMKTYFIGSLLNGGGAVPSPNTTKGWADMYDGFQAQAMDTRLGIPMIYGTDAVHGHNNLYGAVIFPHNIGLGCTRNESLVEELGRITAVEVAATGVDWTFAPCIAVPRDERWGRTYEGFSEDPELVSILGAAAVRGFQGAALDDSLSILACAKHYVGDGGTLGGDDQGNTLLSEEELRRIHLLPYLSAIEAGTGSIMASYNSWNGEKLHGDYYLLTTVLKEELGFDGFIVSDWAAIDQLPGDYISDIENSINAGIDMVMVPADYKTFINGLISLVNEGKVSMERIDDANRRILRKKFEMGLFEKPYTERALFSEVGKAEHREIARQAVRESLVLLKNKNGILPIAKDASHLHVAGRSANNLGYQCGGWSLTWQGGSGDITIGTTVLEAIQSTATGQVTYLEQGYGTIADGAETAVVVIGERPYAEGAGDDNDLSLNQESLDAVKSLYDKGIKVVTVLISGRPMILDDIWHYSDAVIAVWLPGTEGQGVADILFGDYQPSGKLSYTWPAGMDQIPINIGDDPYEPFFPFGYGMESFSPPAIENAPQAISSATGESGEFIELSFDKAMKVPDLSSLTLSVNNNITGISEVRIKEGDPFTLIIVSEISMNENDHIRISSESGIEAQDGSVSGAFSLDVYNATLTYYAIPGKIEAENYYEMSGIQTENTTDTGGGLNVGWIEAGDYMVYNVDIKEGGEYLINYRVASESQGGNLKLQIWVDDQYADLHIVSFSATGGWQNWITVSERAELAEGRQKLRIYAESAGFNVNWFELSSTVGTDVFDSGSETKIILYPNPVQNILNINAGEGEEFHFSIYDMTGRPFRSGQFRYSLAVDVSSYPSGIYLIMIDSGEEKIFRKFRIK